MAMFKAGQRVKFVGPYSPYRQGNGYRIKIGQHGTIIGADDHEPPYRDWLVLYDGVRDPTGSDSYQLAPLTDPKADEFIERIKKLKPYNEPVVVKTKECA